MNGKPIRHPLQLLYRVYRHVKPCLDRTFDFWLQKAEVIPDKELRKQALASMHSKRFHCEGGTVYAAQFVSEVETLVPLIVAYQTISDYLDNLCDRSTSLDPEDFRQLHYALQDALVADAPVRDYYQYRAEKEDAGFLKSLVLACQEQIKKLPSYKAIQPKVLELSVLYSDLQVYKHIAHEKREGELLAWWEKYKPLCPQIYWQEFSAVAGSTIGIFALFCLATQHQVDEEYVNTLNKAYFPWICGLHILLDYLIDLEEDRVGGDLNFVSYYHSDEEALNRLQFFIEQAKANIEQLPYPQFHGMIVDGLVAFYLADRKVNRKQPQIYTISRRLLREASGLTSLLFYLNSLLIRR
ncbi:tetraprenyl-beta-curcumene synthase family protein [Brevibacillus sp. SYSU BS000544]|uniref:tetraprenyl-beta-curcumene synthase family protein n=1 Tax=Brevibacillus sp. SYSU BS000544 TaxID=3416443 RepID=UPI003CE533F1